MRSDKNGQGELSGFPREQGRRTSAAIVRAAGLDQALGCFSRREVIFKLSQHVIGDNRGYRYPCPFRVDARDVEILASVDLALGFHQ